MNTSGFPKTVVLYTILKAWDQFPDLRLGQLLVNASQTYLGTPDIYYLDNIKLMELLEKYCTEHGKDTDENQKAGT